MRQRRLLVLLCCLFLGQATACAATPERPETAAERAANAKRAYDEAMEDYFDGNWERLIPRMEEIERRYANTRYGRLASLRIADAQFEQQKYVQAAASYRSFAKDHPNDPEVAYARFRAAKALFSATGDSIILPPLEERDLAQVREGHQAIGQHLADYPTSKWRAELEYMREVSLGVLARYELYVARFHIGESRFQAAVDRILYTLKNHQGSGLEPEAYVLLAETYLKMKKPEDARALFERVLREYPSSAFVVPAQRFLAKMGASAPAGAHESTTVR